MTVFLTPAASPSFRPYLLPPQDYYGRAVVPALLAGCGRPPWKHSARKRKSKHTTCRPQSASTSGGLPDTRSPRPRILNDATDDRSRFEPAQWRNVAAERLKVSQPINSSYSSAFHYPHESISIPLATFERTRPAREWPLGGITSTLGRRSHSIAIAPTTIGSYAFERCSTIMRTPGPRSTCQRVAGTRKIVLNDVRF